MYDYITFNKEKILHKKSEVLSCAGYHSIKCVTDFDEMKVDDSLLRGIYSYGFEKPSDIQQKAIIPIIRNKDILAQARSGTGKTATYSISILELLDYSVQKVQAIILVPTRELAINVENLIKQIGTFTAARTMYLIGGVNVRDQIQELQRQPHIIVATPGRTLDMINRGILSTESLKIIVVDEADEILARGFKEIISDVFDKIMTNLTQFCVFTSTITPEIDTLFFELQRYPIKILQKEEEQTLEGTKQFFVDTEKEEWKLDTLLDLLEDVSVLPKILIFCNTRRKCFWLEEELKKNDINSVINFGTEDTEQERREKLNQYTDHPNNILILTDLFTRSLAGLDFRMILNYDIPNNFENYLHRTGRRSRFDRKTVISFVSKDQIQQLKELEMYYQTCIEELPVNYLDYVL